MAVEVSGLVNGRAGTVDRRIFVDRELYELELERIFARCWLFLAHESQIPNPGDFVAAYMGEDPVLVVRDSRAKINAFLNTCRHRGMRVCRADQGNAAAFTCTYHGWTYGNDGKLVGVPGYKEYYYEELDMEQWGLVPVAQVDSYKGLIFGTFDPEAPPLVDYLGDFAFYLDVMLDRREGGTEATGGAHKWIMPTNWKFAADNFCGDNYHVGVTHLSAIKVGFSGIRLGGDSDKLPLRHTVVTRYGHGTAIGDPTEFDMPALSAYVQSILPEMEQRLGSLRAQHGWLINGTIFPNFSYVASDNFRTIRVWHPRGPDKIETWAWCIVDRAAPPEIKNETRLANLQVQSGPAASFEQDDGENWGQCTISSAGTMGRRYPFNYQLKLGHEERDEDLPGTLADAPSEANQRGFYDFWGEMMEAESWHEVLMHNARS